MSYKCIFCGKSSDEQDLHHDWPFDHLKIEGMYCWACYHQAIVKREVAAFGLSTIGENSGWIQHYTLPQAIEAALEETEDNIDMGIGIDVPIGGSYTASMIVRNGSLYVRAADLFPVKAAETDEEKRLLLEQIISRLTWNVFHPSINSRGQK